MAESFLAIDGGNTRMKATWFAPDGDLKVYPFAPGDAEGLLSLIERNGVDSAAMASVGHVDGRMAESLRRVLDGRFLLVTPATELPIAVNYDDPRHLGIDRKATSVAASAQYPEGHTLVLDAGTALTCDVVGAGEFIEGSISPGLSMRFKALHEFTAGLPLTGLTDREAAVPSFASDTKGAILSGVARGFLDEISGAIKAAGQRFGPLTAVITGGDSRFIMNAFSRSGEADRLCRCQCVTRIIHDPHLLAKGIRAIYRHNENEI